MPPGQVENFQLLLPMLTQLNQERRWLAWIDPPQELVSKWQTMHGIVANELLVLRSSRDYSAYELAERALGAGTCHAVVMWTRRLSGQAFSALEQAKSGRAFGVSVRGIISDYPLSRSMKGVMSPGLEIVEIGFLPFHSIIDLTYRLDAGVNHGSGHGHIPVFHHLPGFLGERDPDQGGRIVVHPLEGVVAVAQLYDFKK